MDIVALIRVHTKHFQSFCLLLPEGFFFNFTNFFFFFFSFFLVFNDINFKGSLISEGFRLWSQDQQKVTMFSPEQKIEDVSCLLLWMGITNQKEQMTPRCLSLLTRGFEFGAQPIKITKKYFFLIF